MEPTKGETRLPPNAYKVLGPGETYTPYVPSDRIIPETTLRAVIIGIIMTVLFTAMFSAISRPMNPAPITNTRSAAAAEALIRSMS